MHVSPGQTEVLFPGKSAVTPRELREQPGGTGLTLSVPLLPATGHKVPEDWGTFWGPQSLGSTVPLRLPDLFGHTRVSTAVSQTTGPTAKVLDEGSQRRELRRSQISLAITNHTTGERKDGGNLQLPFEDVPSLLSCLAARWPEPYQPCDHDPTTFVTTSPRHERRIHARSPSWLRSSSTLDTSK